MRSNTFNESTNELVISTVRLKAIQSNSEHYTALFTNDPAMDHLREAYAVRKNSVTNLEDVGKMSAFFFWASWACMTNRPGSDITYTNNWPNEPLVDNVPNKSLIVWSGFSVIMLLIGIALLGFYHAKSRGHEELEETLPQKDPLTGIKATPSMKATLKYFWIVSGLIVLQVIFGAVTAHFGVEGDAFFGLSMDNLLPYGVSRTWHVQQTSQKEEVLDVSMGKLSLEQINLIFRHLPIDLSYVDENDIVKFYSDTKHRVFPRSAGVIGREVQNCHPRESVGTVEEIIAAFRSGEQDQAEFWLEMGGQFIYIIYNAVRDEKGNFRGVLEMMQNATHIRSLTGSQKLLSWDHQPKADSKEEKEANLEISGKTKIGVLLKQYPFLKPFLIGLNPKFERLNNPIIFKTMETVATIERITDRGGFSTEELIEKLQGEIQRKNKC